MRFRFLAIPLLVGGLALLGWAAPGAAQDAPAQPAAGFTDEQLESFASAAVKVDEIGRKWIAQIQAEPDETKAAQLRDRANAEMVRAVEAEGLTAQEYNRIFIAARDDPALRERIAQMTKQDD